VNGAPAVRDTRACEAGTELALASSALDTDSLRKRRNPGRPAREFNQSNGRVVGGYREGAAA